MNKTIPITLIDPQAEVKVDYREWLNKVEISAIEHECALYESRPAAAIDALQIVQRERGWISDESLYAIADILGMSAAELEVSLLFTILFIASLWDNTLFTCAIVLVAGYMIIKALLIIYVRALILNLVKPRQMATSPCFPMCV